MPLRPGDLAGIPKKIFISAGEYSGDLLGAELVHSFNAHGLANNFYGVSGPAMQSAGVVPVAQISEFSVMGISEVLAKMGSLALLEKKIFSAVHRIKPDFVITIDFPGFHFRLAEFLRLSGIPVYQYVAPKLWAWGASRASRLKRDFSGVLGILPFERDFFVERAIRYEYVGCPLADRVRPYFSRRICRESRQGRKVLLLPGSRMAEIDAIAPLILRSALLLQSRISGISFVLPVAPSLDLDIVRSRFGGLNQLRVTHGNSLEMMGEADVAIAASGTATLECALMELPMVVVYEVNPLTYAVMRNRIATQWISLVNLIADSGVVPEFIQNVDPRSVADHVERLLANESVRNQQLQALRDIRLNLAGSAADNAVKILDRWSLGR